MLFKEIIPVRFEIFTAVRGRPRWSSGSVLAAGSNPAKDDGFLRVIKILSMTSFGGK
jgi:hypothetical protein